MRVTLGFMVLVAYIGYFFAISEEIRSFGNLPKLIIVNVSTSSATGRNLKTKCCFMKHNFHFHRGIAQSKNAAMPLSSKGIHAIY